MKKILWTLAACYLVSIPGVCFGDETAIFSYAVSPDALILLDLSGSMDDNPSGGSSGDSKLTLAKDAIQAILDDDGSGTIDSNDETSLNIRIGYMRFYNCSSDDTEGSYSSGCNSLQNAIPNTDPPPFSSPSRYSDMWSKVNGESANGGTPLASALNEAKLYLDAHKAADAGKSCRQKFVILVTDGQDTYACNGNGSENQSDMYKRRKATVAKAKALFDAGYKVFVIGFGAAMPDELKNTLNWAAYFGGTNNISIEQTGNTSAISPSTDPCNEGGSNDPGSAPLSGYAFLATDAFDLSDALKRAFDFINNSRLSFTASSVAAFRTTAENYLYEASFQPVNGDPFWLGHLIKYNINSDGSVGSQVWDAGSLLQDQAASTRNIYTYMSGGITSFTISNFSSSGARAKLGSSITSTQAQAIIGYVRGDSTYNPDDWKLGDIFHSNPVAIGSPSAYFTDIHSPQAFTDFRNTNASRKRIIVLGANDGQFHAFDSSDGSEKWSFIPPNVLPKLQYIAHSTEPTTLTHKYLVDGPVIVADVWLGSGDGTSKSASDWHTYLVFGEGKGVRDSYNQNPSFLWSSSSSCDTGFNKTYSATYSNYCGYYAFEVTNTALSTPVFKWRLNFTGTPSSAQTQQYLGEPWSKMAIGRVKISGNEKWVGFISAGCYWSSSTNYCSSTSTNPGKGFYVVDLSDGHVLWSFTKGSSDTNITSTKMTYSLPASPAILDTDNDGFIDTAYVGDFGGNMWRFKFCGQSDTSCDTGSWKGGLLFQASSGRPIYYSAAVARGDSSSLWVFWGTGDKEAPIGTGGTDKFFGIKDDDRTTTYTISNLQDISTAGTTYSDTSKNGWYITLAGTGEKVLADPTVFGGIVMFTTYTPTTSSSDPCARIGTAKLYAIAMMRVSVSGYKYDPGAGILSTPGSPSSTSGGARSMTLGSGMAKEPVVSQKPTPGGSTDLYISVSGGLGVSTSIISDVQLGSTPLTDRLKTTTPSNQVIHWKDGRVQ